MRCRAVEVSLKRSGGGGFEAERWRWVRRGAVEVGSKWVVKVGSKRDGEGRFDAGRWRGCDAGDGGECSEEWWR